MGYRAGGEKAIFFYRGIPMFWRRRHSRLHIRIRFSHLRLLRYASFPVKKHQNKKKAKNVSVGWKSHVVWYYPGTKSGGGGGRKEADFHGGLVATCVRIINYYIVVQPGGGARKDVLPAAGEGWEGGMLEASLHTTGEQASTLMN